MGARMRGLGARVVAMMIKAGEILAMANAVPYSTLEERLGDGGLVVIAPHPDDESLACGGLIAEAQAEGRTVRVVIVSEGTGCPPASKGYPRARLRELRGKRSKRGRSRAWTRSWPRGCLSAAAGPVRPQRWPTGGKGDRGDNQGCRERV